MCSWGLLKRRKCCQRSSVLHTNSTVSSRVWMQEEVEDTEGPTQEGEAARKRETGERHRAPQLQTMEIFFHFILFKPVYRRQGCRHQRLGSGPAALTPAHVWDGGLQHNHRNTQRRWWELRFVDNNASKHWIKIKHLWILLKIIKCRFKQRNKCHLQLCDHQKNHFRSAATKRFSRMISDVRNTPLSTTCSIFIFVLLVS